jgi:CRP-like cAMP-binding protein
LDRLHSQTCMEYSSEPRKTNLILAALPDDVYESLEPHLERHAFQRSVVLHKPGEEIRDLYFPVDCLISITVTMRDGHTAETGVVGSREMVGVNAFMGGHETTQTEYIVQIGGVAMRVAATPLREAFDRDKRVRDVFLKYTQSLVAQISQNAACNSLHPLERRYARWLLEVHDRVWSDEIPLTHEFMSEMLGVRRAGITELAGKLEREGVLQGGRGWTRIVDMDRLKSTACECHAVLQEEYERLLGRHVPRR